MKKKPGRKPGYRVKERMVRTDEGAEYQMESSDGKKVGMNMSFDQMKEMMVAMMTEMKKPDQATLDKAEKDRIELQRRQDDMIKVANIELAATKAMRDSCGHRKENGRTLFMGQLCSDGLFHAICFRCQLELAPQRPSPELMMNS